MGRRPCYGRMMTGLCVFSLFFLSFFFPFLKKRGWEGQSGDQTNCVRGVGTYGKEILNERAYEGVLFWSCIQRKD